MTGLFPTENSYSNYQPKPASHFKPDTIVLSKGICQTTQQHDFVQAICNLYPQAQVIERLDISHNRFELGSSELLELHYKGKKTLLFGVHKSALRFSNEDGNACPNYWHFSPYGFCPEALELLGSISVPLKMINEYNSLIVGRRQSSYPPIRH